MTQAGADPVHEWTPIVPLYFVPLPLLITHDGQDKLLKPNESIKF